jgi:hypothetical protein
MTRGGTLRAVFTASLFFHALTLFVAGQQSQKATLQGVVRFARTNDPVAGARVTLIPQTSAPIGPRETLPLLGSVLTDQNGGFVFTDLEPGSVRLSIGLNGYVRYDSTLALTAGQVKDDIAVRLVQTATVSGHISSLTGKPVAGVEVQIQRRSYNTNGSFSFGTVATAQTNDLGDYRAYWVAPGQYYISVRGSQGESPLGGGSFDDSARRGVNRVTENYPQTFYPGVTDGKQALPVELPEGKDISGIDFRLPRQTQLHAIRGRVIDGSTGQSPPMAQVLMGGSWSIQWFDRSTGTFEIKGLTPGRYNLQARLGDPNSRTNPVQTGFGDPIAQAVVTIIDSDVENVALTIAPPLLITGQMKVEGELPSATPIERLRISLASSSPSSGPTPSAAVGADGTFKMNAPVDGEYRLTVSGLPAGFYLKDARFNNTDVLEPTRISTAGTLDVLVSSKTGQLAGRIVSQPERPQSRIGVVLIPNSNRDRAELYKRATTSIDGSFTITGIPPGDYKAFAWERLEANSFYDPQVLGKYEQWGTPVRVTESSSESIEVKLIPEREGQ